MLFLLVFRFSLVSITPPVLHAHSFIHIRPTVHTQCRQLRTPLNNTLGGGGGEILKVAKLENREKKTFGGLFSTG